MNTITNIDQARANRSDRDYQARIDAAAEKFVQAGMTSAQLKMLTGLTKEQLRVLAEVLTEVIAAEDEHTK